MSVYEELDPMLKHRTQFAFKGKRSTLLKPTHQTRQTQLNTSTSKYLMVRETM